MPRCRSAIGTLRLELLLFAWHRHACQSVQLLFEPCARLAVQEALPLSVEGGTVATILRCGPSSFVLHVLRLTATYERYTASAWSLRHVDLPVHLFQLVCVVALDLVVVVEESVVVVLLLLIDVLSVLLALHLSVQESSIILLSSILTTCSIWRLFRHAWCFFA